VGGAFRGAVDPLQGVMASDLRGGCHPPHPMIPCPAMASDVRQLLDDFRARMEARSVPEELWPSRYRFRCWACEDRGVEYYDHPDFPDLPFCRPCPHCEKGQEIFRAWTRPKGALSPEDKGGLWRGLSRKVVLSIYHKPCEHPMLPNLILKDLEEGRK
jgi:hypothetical protein